MRANPTDTLERQWAVLRALPAWPQAITVTALTKLVNDDGIKATHRTIDRDLQQLSDRFPIAVDDTGKTFRWSWKKSAGIDALPRLSVPQCLALTLARQHVHHLLPQDMLDDLAPLFDAAERELARTPWKDWHKRTAVAPPAFVLQPPRIQPKAFSDARQALAHRLLLTASYRSGSNMTATIRKLHPLGLLGRGNLQYLVCMQNEDTEPRQFALHRMSDTSYGSQPCRELHGFSMTRYAARSLAINSHGRIRLRAHFLDSAAIHLRETELSKYQTWRPISGTNKVEICATVDDDLQLKRYLLSFGSEMEVIEPERLRRDIAEELRKARGFYEA